MLFDFSVFQRVWVCLKKMVIFEFGFGPHFKNLPQGRLGISDLSRKYREAGNICSGGLSMYFWHLPRHIFLTFAFLYISFPLHFLINPYIFMCFPCMLYFLISSYMFLVFLMSNIFGCPVAVGSFVLSALSSMMPGWNRPDGSHNFKGGKSNFDI